MEVAELAVFVRAPVAGSVKTRLHPLLGSRGATELYCAFVEDTIALCNRVREAGRVRLSLWADDVRDASVRSWAERLGTTPHQQPEGDLGARLSAAFSRGLANAERVVVIGSDSPTLPLSSIVAAFNRLAHAALVLGPSNDGGYCIIGASGSLGGLPSFTGVRWSTEHAFRDTCAANASRDLETIPPWYDVDDEDDLQTLRAHLSARPNTAPATSAALRRLQSIQR